MPRLSIVLAADGSSGLASLFPAARRYAPPKYTGRGHRSRWEFRRDPDDLTPSKRKALEALFAEIPILQQLYEVRLEFKRIFDTAPDPATAERGLAELRARARALGLDFDKFWTTYDNWKTGILNYFDGRYTSAAVEGINNKGRVITKRCYGVKSAHRELLAGGVEALKEFRRHISSSHGALDGHRTTLLPICTPCGPTLTATKPP